jgi:predicted DCC family thiol-disulfide oxidoreductase YuxK
MIKVAGFKTIFGCDLRTLALFRVSLGVLISADLWLRARDLRAHYTDFGILPRADLIGQFDSWYPSLHLASGSAVYQILLFAVAAITACALLVGYRTRLATFLSWFLLISLQERNVYILQGGDVLLVMLLFWGMFLPLGARFSIDAALDTSANSHSNNYASMATMALKVQCMSVYFFSALLKSDPAWLPEGTAVAYALQLDYLATQFAVWFRQFPELLHALTYYVWWLQMVGSMLMFSPVFHMPLRIALMFMFISMHIGFFLSLEIGLFPFISIAALLTFTPGFVWDWLGKRIRTRERMGVAVYYDGECEFCKKISLLLRTFFLLPDTAVEPAQSYADIYREMQEYNSWVVVDYDGSRHVRWRAVVLVVKRSFLFWPVAYVLGAPIMRAPGDRIYEMVAVNRDWLGAISAVALPYRELRIRASRGADAVIGAFMLLVFYINLMTLPAFPYSLWDPLRSIEKGLRLTQNWNMFAPFPPKIGGWHVVRGELADGTPVDFRRGILGEPSFAKPLLVSREYTSYRWRKYLNLIAHEKYKLHRPYYAQYLCRLWNENKTAEFKLTSLKLYYVTERTLPDFETSEPETLLFWKQNCGPG